MLACFTYFYTGGGKTDFNVRGARGQMSVKRLSFRFHRSQSPSVCTCVLNYVLKPLSLLRCYRDAVLVPWMFTEPLFKPLTRHQIIQISL